MHKWLLHKSVTDDWWLYAHLDLKKLRTWHPLLSLKVTSHVTTKSFRRSETFTTFSANFLSLNCSIFYLKDKISNHYISTDQKKKNGKLVRTHLFKLPQILEEHNELENHQAQSLILSDRDQVLAQSLIRKRYTKEK